MPDCPQHQTDRHGQIHSSPLAGSRSRKQTARLDVTPTQGATDSSAQAPSSSKLAATSLRDTDCLTPPARTGLLAPDRTVAAPWPWERSRRQALERTQRALWKADTTGRSRVGQGPDMDCQHGSSFALSWALCTLQGNSGSAR